jgi:hypothetical protein
MARSTASKKKSKKNTAPPPTSLLWIGVTTSLIIIVIILGWSFKVQFGFLNWKNSNERALLDTTTANWQQAFTAVASESDLQKQINKMDIEDVLRDIVTSSTNLPGNTLSSTTTPTTTN